MVLWKTAVLIGAFGGTAFALLHLSGAGQAAGASQQPYTSDVQLTIKRSPVDVAPDGDLSKTLWKRAESVEFD